MVNTVAATVTDPDAKQASSLSSAGVNRLSQVSSVSMACIIALISLILIYATQSGIVTRSSAGWNVKSDDSSDRAGSEDEIEEVPETDESKDAALKPEDRSVKYAYR